MTENVVRLDVREDIRKGQEPFTKIMSTVHRLQAGEQLLLVAPFEPVPLYAILSKSGFSHQASRQDSGDWEVLFNREDSPTLARGGPTSPIPQACNPKLEVDARGLEPPQPLIQILETLANLPKGGELIARTDRRPVHLYAQLEERGFVGETSEQSDGSFLTLIKEAGESPDPKAEL